MRAGSRRLRIACALLLVSAGAGRAENLTLLDCLRETAEHNPQIVGQRLNIERATGARLTFRSRAFPSLNLNGLVGDQGQREAETLQIAPVRGANGQILVPGRASNELRSSTFLLIGNEALSQPIFDVGIPAAWRRANVEIPVAKANFAAVAVAQLHSAHTLFLAGLFARQNEAILREVSASQTANAATHQQLFNSGLVDRGKLLAAQVQAANAQPGIFDASRSYRGAVAQLLQVMGRSVTSTPADQIELTGVLGAPTPSFDVPKLAREALERRPDLAALRESLRQLKEDANTVRAGYYPLVRIYVNGRLLPESFATDRVRTDRPDDETRTSEADFGVREDWTVIDTGNVRGNVNRIEYLRAGVEVGLHQAELIIPSQLVSLKAQWESANRQVDLLTGNVGVAQKTLTSINQSLTQGVATELDFYDAQIGVAQARTGLLAEQLEASQTQADFDLLVGNYLRFTTSNPKLASP